MAQRLHVLELLNEYLRIFDVELKSTLNLKSVNKGSIAWLPAPAISSMVNGIWINPEPAIKLERIQMPKDLLITYTFRVVYIKRIDVNTNVETQKITDINIISEKLLDKYALSDLSLTNGQVLWSFPTSIEINPPEDEFVSLIASDLVGSSFNVDCQVRTRLI
jgi:hypothetical protein